MSITHREGRTEDDDDREVDPVNIISLLRPFLTGSAEPSALGPLASHPQAPDGRPATNPETNVTSAQPEQGLGGLQLEEAAVRAFVAANSPCR